MLAAGNYRGKLIEAGIEDWNGEAFPFMKFQLDNGEQIRWSGNLKSEKAAIFCMKTLVSAGYKSDNFNDLNVPGADSIMFEQKDLELVVNHNQKGYAQVQFVNEYGAKKEKAAKRFEGQVGAQYKGLFAKVRADMGAKAASVAPTAEGAPF